MYQYKYIAYMQDEGRNSNAGPPYTFMFGLSMLPLYPFLLATFGNFRQQEGFHPCLIYP